MSETSKRRSRGPSARKWFTITARGVPTKPVLIGQARVKASSRKAARSAALTVLAQHVKGYAWEVAP